MKRINIINKSSCCGCGACAAVCGCKAIDMKPDGLGFAYPTVDMDRCVECGLCQMVCAFHEHYDRSLNFPNPDIYAVRNKNIAELETSRSGAMFTVVSDWILDAGGVVYGAGYTEHFRVVHKRAVTKAERNEFKGSKYVQSDMDTIFKQVLWDLKNGLYVLFTGTPCQTSALRSYLTLHQIKMNQLYVCDLVCHGVPSPYYWRDYLAYIEKECHKSIVEVNFRDKSIDGWNGHKESFRFDDGSKRGYSHYSYVFSKKINYRYSCGVCYFTNFIRPSDITLADFWGWEKVMPDLNRDDKGVSLVLINTCKGRWLFDMIKNGLDFVKTDSKHAMQPNLQYPTQLSPKRKHFEADYMKYGFIYVGKKYGDLGYAFKLRRLAQKVKKTILKNYKE